MTKMYYQNNIPGPARIFGFTLNNFVGGLNNRDYDPNENQCVSVMNMAFTTDGVMEKRRGTEQFDTLVMDAPVTYIDEFKPHQEESILVRASNTELYFGNAFARKLVGQMHGTNYEGKYFFGDTSALYSYGRFDQESSTYVRIVGTPTPHYVLMKVVSTPPDFTALGTEHVQGVRVVDYDKGEVWYEPCEHEMVDTFKGISVVPTKPRFFATREGRLYSAGSDDNDDTVYISDSGNPFYFPVSLSLQLPPNSDRITGLAIYNDAVIVGRRLDIHAIFGDTNRTDSGLPVYKLKKLNSHTGIANQRSIVNVHNYLYFMGTDSHVYSLYGTEYTLDALSTTLLTKTVDIHSAPIAVQKDDIWSASATFYNDCYYLSVGNKIMVYHYMHRAWTVYDQIEATSFYPIITVLLMGDKKGRTVMPSEHFLDCGKPFRAHWTTKYLTMGESNTVKMFREFFIVTRSSKDYTSRVNLLFKVDYANLTTEIDILTKLSVYGKSVFGDYFISREINASSNFLIYRRGRGVSITLWNGEYEHNDVQTVEELPSLGDYNENGKLTYVHSENAYYTVRVVNDVGDREWYKMERDEYDQGMCVLEVNGEYEMKWKR